MTQLLEQIGNPQARLEAIRQVADWSDDPVGTLLSALRDPYPHVRFEAAAALCEIDEAISPLVEIATDDSDDPAAQDARRAALLGLRRVLPQNVLKQVSPLADDRDPIVRYHTLLAIHENREQLHLESFCDAALSDDDDDVAIIGAQWAAQNGWTQKAPLVWSAWDKRPRGEVRLQFALALLELDPSYADDVLPDLKRALKDDRIARPATLAIAQHRIGGAADGLKKVTRRFWYHVVLRIDAAAALVVLEDPDGDAKFRDFLNDRKEHVAAYACECVGRYELTAYVPVLKSLLSAGDDRSLAAVVALKQIDHDSARDALKFAQTSGDENVAAAARS